MNRPEKRNSLVHPLREAILEQLRDDSGTGGA